MPGLVVVREVSDGITAMDAARYGQVAAVSSTP